MSPDKRETIFREELHRKLNFTKEQNTFNSDVIEFINRRNPTPSNILALMIMLHNHYSQPMRSLLGPEASGAQ